MIEPGLPKPFVPTSPEATATLNHEPISEARVKRMRIRGTVQILLGLGILVWPAVVVVSAFMYPSSNGNTSVELIALIGLPLLGLCLLLVGIGIENLVRARRLSR